MPAGTKVTVYATRLAELDQVDKSESGLRHLTFVEQDEKLASYAQKIDKSEAEINWNEKAKIIIAKINAFYPSPGSWFKHNGSRVKITKAQERRSEGTPGEILNKNFTIACQENSIQILELQKEGKKKMKTSEYLKANNHHACY